MSWVDTSNTRVSARIFLDNAVVGLKKNLLVYDVLATSTIVSLFLIS